MKPVALPLLLLLGAASAEAKSSAPLADPVALNIGLSCQWQEKCIKNQTKAMKRALKYLRNEDPPSWRLATCNRNASRKRNRVDWVGFNNCIRNAERRPPPPRPVKRPPKRVIQSSNPPSRSKGERG